MRWAIILIIALGLSVLAVYKNQERPVIRDILATTTPETIILYEDGILGFGVTYQHRDEIESDNFEGFLPVTAAPVVGFQLPSTLFTGTNLTEAGVYIGASSSPAVRNACTILLRDGTETSSGTTTINSVIWNVSTSTGAGAGNFYESKIYRTVHGNYCFEMVELLHSGNIHNYPDGTVVEFDKVKFQILLDAIAQSFSFTK